MNAFYEDLFKNPKESRIEKEKKQIEAIRVKIKEYDEEKYIAAKASLKKDIDTISFWNNMFSYLAILVAIGLAFFNFEFNSGILMNVLFFITVVVTLVALYKWDQRGKYIKLLSVLEDSEDIINY